MKKGHSLILMALAVLMLGIIVPQQLSASPIAIDEIIFQPDGFDPTVLSGTADFSYSGNVLTIIITNTSSATGVNGAVNLMTGIGFNLPSSLSINTIGIHDLSIPSGSIYLDKQPPENLLEPLEDKWGYDEVDTGPFYEIPVAGTVNTAATTLQAAIDRDFRNVLAPPANVNGPSLGLLSSLVNPSIQGGQDAIQDSIRIDMVLTGSYSGDLLQYIQDGHVVASFGSPTASVIPEPTSLLLFGTGLGALGLVARRRRRK